MYVDRIHLHESQTAGLMGAFYHRRDGRAQFTFCGGTRCGENKAQAVVTCAPMYHPSYVELDTSDFEKQLKLKLHTNDAAHPVAQFSRNPFTNVQIMHQFIDFSISDIFHNRSPTQSTWTGLGRFRLIAIWSSSMYLTYKFHSILSKSELKFRIHFATMLGFYIGVVIASG